MTDGKAHRIGSATLEAGICRLTGPTGSVHLEPRVADLAAMLARNAGEVISRNTLIESVWEGYPGADQSLTSAISKLRRALEESGADASVVETVRKRGYRLKLQRDTRPPEHDRIGLAVLPFRNLGTNQDDAYLCEGLAEELINRLTGIRALRVAARTSSFALAHRGAGLGEIGDQLGVSYVIDGSVQRFGEQLRIRVGLLDPKSETQLWSHDFELAWQDLFRIQDSIAATVLAKIVDRIGIETAPPASSSQDRSRSPSAMKAFLKGRYFWYRDNANPGKAIDYFQQAIEADPDFAAPHAGLVDCYCTYGVWQLMPQEEARARALQSAERALVLAPESADVQFSHGYAQFYARWRWEDAERAMRRAIEIDPEHVLAHSFLGLLAVIRHRDEESAAFGNRLVEMDPLSPWCWCFHGMLAYYRRDYELGAFAAGEALELEAGNLFALWVGSASLAHLGRRKEAIEMAEQLEAIAGEADLFMGCAAAAFAVAGDEKAARRVMAELDRRDRERGVSPLVFSFALPVLGDHERALTALQSAYEQRNMAMFYVSRESYADPVRDRREFKSVLQRLDLGP